MFNLVENYFLSTIRDCLFSTHKGGGSMEHFWGGGVKTKLSDTLYSSKLFQYQYCFHMNLCSSVGLECIEYIIDR